MSNIGILGKKVGMTRVYDEKGIATPVTVILAEPNVITQVKTQEKDSYRAVQLAVGRKSARQTPNPLLGHFKKANTDAKAFVREFHTNGGDYTLGQTINVTVFHPGQFVDVIGVSKGKGFQGTMRKHNFHGQAETHGSTMHRRNGAIGCRSTPGRVFRNMGMPGHMGDERCTIQNLKIVQVRQDDNVLLVRGAIPGANGSYVVVRDAVKGQPKVVVQPVATKPGKPEAQKAAAKPAKK